MRNAAGSDYKTGEWPQRRPLIDRANDYAAAVGLLNLCTFVAPRASSLSIAAADAVVADAAVGGAN